MPHDDHVWLYRLREIVHEEMGLAEAAEHLQLLLGERLAAFAENVHVSVDGSEVYMTLPFSPGMLSWRG